MESTTTIFCPKCNRRFRDPGPRTRCDCGTMVTSGAAPSVVPMDGNKLGSAGNGNALYDLDAMEIARANKPSLPVSNQISMRRRICKACEHNKAGRCGIISVTGKAGELEHPNGIPNHLAFCPLPQPKFGPIVPPKTIADSHGTYITRQRLTDDIQHLFAILFSAVPNIKGIIGVPRSGMVVASQLAVLSGLPLYTVTKAGIIEVGHGQRLSGKKNGIPGPLALVEDSVASGRSMRKAKEQCKRDDIVSCSVYATSHGLAAVDLYAVSLELPHFFEWHIFGSTLIPAWGFGLDFDGILCRDCLPGEDDDGPNYLRFLKTVPPLRLPRPHTVPAIITARIEKYRRITEQWLARHNIKFDKLIMGPWASQRERNGKDIGAWKAEQIQANGIRYFVESEDRQAKTIAEKAGIPVICPATERIYRGTAGHKANSIPTAKKYKRGSMDEHCVAVTALSQHPVHLARQTVCLDSWIDFGFTIVAVNTSAEKEKLLSVYPQVSQWIVSEETTTLYDKPTQEIWSLCQAAVTIDKPILLINSDIEIYGTQEDLISRIGSNKLLGGIRHDYPVYPVDGFRQPWGIDAFYMTPQMAKTIPRLPMGIGGPTWDYWLPLHFRLAGFEIDLIGEPLFFHRAHETLWNEREWLVGAKMIRDHYGYDMEANRLIFREELPFPPGR